MLDYLVVFAVQGAVASGMPPPDEESNGPAIVETVGDEPDGEGTAEVTSDETAKLQEVAIPAKHPVIISIEGQVGSKISEPKDMFPIKQVQSVVSDGREVLPAGIMGEGQVVHADKAGFGGNGGELILAARYLMLDDRKIELRSFKFIEEDDEILSRGKDNTDLTFATVVAVGLVGFLIGGGNTTIEPGTLARAKLRNEEAFEFENSRVPSPQ